MDKKNKKKNTSTRPSKLSLAITEAHALLEKNDRYKKNKIIGYLNTYPHPIGLKTFQESIKYNPNNLGLYTHYNLNSGFKGSNFAEMFVIDQLRNIFKGKKEITGYISPGGTEANIVSLWAARNKFKSRRIAILCSFLTHYSIKKAVDILGIESKNGSGLHLLGTDKQGHLLTNNLENKIKKIINKNIEGIIIVANAGTTMLGAIDDIPTINKIIKKYKTKEFKNIHFHVDAAFGGMIIPFIKEKTNISFENSEIDSITVDMHKMGLAPFGSGVILMKKHLFKKINTSCGYINWEDKTLCGSRPGSMAICCYSLLKHFGIEGYEKNAKKVIILARYLKLELEKLGLKLFDNDLNILTVIEPSLKIFKNLSNLGYRMHFQKNFPKDLSKPLIKRNNSIWNIVITPTMNRNFLKNFIQETQKIIIKTNNDKKILR